MFDTDKAKQLEKQSHVRGILSKEFFSGEQSQLQKKRKQMKRILDEQVEQRKRVKQKQKQEVQRKQKKEDDQMKRYYEGVIQRERRPTENNSIAFNQKNSLADNGSFNQNESLVRKHYQQNMKQRSQSKTVLQEIDAGEIPLMTVMAMSDNHLSANLYNQASNSTSNNKNSIYNSGNFQRQNAGNIPLLDLSDENYSLKNRKKSKTQFKKEKSERQNNLVNEVITANNTKIQESRNSYQYNQSFSMPNALYGQNSSSLQNMKKHERQKTMSDQDNGGLNQQNFINSRVSKGSKYQENMSRSPESTKRQTHADIPEQIQEMQNQNKALKSELKKSQEAISLLIGAVRSNTKLDKFRIQAQKILHSSEKQSKLVVYQQKNKQKRQESSLLLPKLKVKHQSIMHDYLLQAAKKARSNILKTQPLKH